MVLHYKAVQSLVSVSIFLTFGFWHLCREYEALKMHILSFGS